MRKSTLTTLCLLASVALSAQTVDMKVLENGGTGPYKAAIVTDESLPDYTIYRPQDLKAASEAEGPLPVMVWANGGCSNTSITHELVLNEVASQGYVIVAVGPLRHSGSDGFKPSSTDGTHITKALDWLAEQSRKENSEYNGTVNAHGVAAGGQSCGGAQILSLAGDRRIRTYLMVNSGMGDITMSNASKANFEKLRGSIIYILGGESDVAYANAVKDYDNIKSETLPVVFASVDRGHMGTFPDAHGGSYSQMITDWLDYTLKNDRKKIGIFRDADLKDYPGWTLKSKNFAASEFEYPSVHDPVIAFCEGRYYIFTTGLSVLSSADMKTWRHENGPFKQTPQWALDKGFRGMPWAPDIQYIDGMWYLYYSYSGFGKNKSAIGVAVNKTLNPESPDYKWEDKGMILESIPGRDEWNAIDANVALDDEGNAWLSFGSFWRGIKITKLDETHTRLTNPEVWYPISRRPEGTAPETVSTDTAVRPDPRGKDFDAGNGAVEAPFIIKHGDYYYLFVSFDLCCRGAKSTYNVVVGRSKNIYGPYYDKKGVDMMESGGTPVAQPNKQYVGIGHNGIGHFNGKDYIVMHGYDKDYNHNSMLVIREINWTKDGWPTIKL